MAMHDRLIFVNEAFGILGKFNGGFLKGSRTADNIFILTTSTWGISYLKQRQSVGISLPINIHTYVPRLEALYMP